MPRKVFNVTVEFDLHAVTCPGVWLCPKGQVSLSVAMFDRSVETRDLRPAFPLLVHETFTFSHSFRRVRYLQDLAQLLRGQLLSIQLIQWGPSLRAGNVLSTFETSLEELLFPAPRSRALLAGVDVDLLMEPTDVFPGIIAPKLEVSTRTTIEEALTSSLCGDQSSVFAKTLISKTAGAQNKRQRRVCHSLGYKLRGSTWRFPGSPSGFPESPSRFPESPSRFPESPPRFPGSVSRFPESPPRFPGRRRPQSCLVRRRVASLREPTTPAWQNDGVESSSSLTPIQRLMWEATSRDLRGPLAPTDLLRSPPIDLLRSPHERSNEESPDADADLRTWTQRDLTNTRDEGTPKAGMSQSTQRRCTKCSREERQNAGSASLRDPQRSESTTSPAKGAVGSERSNRLSLTSGIGARRYDSSTANETLRDEAALSASAFERAAARSGSTNSRASRAGGKVSDWSTPSAVRRDTSLASTSPAALRSERVGTETFAPRRTSCAACARERSDQRGEPNRANRRSKKHGRCCGGDACACAGKENACAGKENACAGKEDFGTERLAPSLRNHGGHSSMERLTLFSRRGTSGTSYRESFYRNLEKFYKRLYDQALERRNGTCGC